MAPVAIQPAQLSDVLFMEGEREFSREEITVTDGAVLEIGTPVAVVGGEYVAHAPAASDGSKNCIGISICEASPDGADGKGVAIVRHAQIKRSGIKWAAGITSPQKDTAIAALDNLNILIRDDA